MSNKLLVVDDNYDLRKTVVLMLGKNCEVLEAASGQEALKIIEAEHPRLVLLDLAMPGMSGLEVLESLKNEGDPMTVIMLTCASDVDLAKRALELGASEYITKPCDWRQLEARVRRSLGTPGPGAQETEEKTPWRAEEGISRWEGEGGGDGKEEGGSK